MSNNDESDAKIVDEYLLSLQARAAGSPAAMLNIVREDFRKAVVSYEAGVGLSVGLYVRWLCKSK